MLEKNIKNITLNQAVVIVIYTHILKCTVYSLFNINLIVCHCKLYFFAIGIKMKFKSNHYVHMGLQTDFNRFGLQIDLAPNRFVTVRMKHAHKYF